MSSTDDHPALVRTLVPARELDVWLPGTRKRMNAVGITFLLGLVVAGLALWSSLPFTMMGLLPIASLERRWIRRRLDQKFAHAITDFAALSALPVGTSVVVGGRMRARKQLHAISTNTLAIGHRVECAINHMYVAMHEFDLLDDHDRALPIEVGPSTIIRSLARVEFKPVDDATRAWAAAHGVSGASKMAETLFLDGAPARVLGVIAHRPDPDGATLGREAATRPVLTAAPDAPLRIII